MNWRQFPEQQKGELQKKNSIDKSLIRFRLRKRANNEELGKPGRRFDFD